MARGCKIVLLTYLLWSYQGTVRNFFVDITIFLKVGTLLQCSCHNLFRIRGSPNIRWSQIWYIHQTFSKCYNLKIKFVSHVHDFIMSLLRKCYMVMPFLEKKTLHFLIYKMILKFLTQNAACARSKLFIDLELRLQHHNLLFRIRVKISDCFDQDFSFYSDRY